MAISPDLLRRARMACGLSQVEAAERAGISRATLQNAEVGKWSPRADTLVRLARLYGVSIDSLFTHDSNGTGDREARKQKNRPTPAASRR
jgi:transcriptional regulator with XRE-family HTH domain